ncbi:unnamed protein product [Gongylonema pulchrum]|uniref:Fibronectin type-III domain-containing protein n=1 Tax=Gongylonema pulchrum TaxID=637853 RepID=A0A3P7NV51_9BILA|nr:unnamed protein product [Gongylonema pulchrum]
MGKNGKILVETPEIRARNEMVSIKCESDELTAPRNLEVTQTGQYSIAISWEPPECGSVGEYHIEVPISACAITNLIMLAYLIVLDYSSY